MRVLTKEHEIIPPNLDRVKVAREGRGVLLPFSIPYDQRPHEALGVEHVEMVHHLPFVDHCLEAKQEKQRKRKVSERERAERGDEGIRS